MTLATITMVQVVMVGTTMTRTGLVSLVTSPADNLVVMGVQGVTTILMDRGAGATTTRTGLVTSPADNLVVMEVQGVTTIRMDPGVGTTTTQTRMGREVGTMTRTRTDLETDREATLVRTAMTITTTRMDLLRTRAATITTTRMGRVTTNPAASLAVMGVQGTTTLTRTARPETRTLATSKAKVRLRAVIATSTRALNLLLKKPDTIS